MWGVELARDVTQSQKLWALFGTSGPVEPGKVYGDIAQGTARVLYTPAMTHPAEHISNEAIGYSLDWFAKTLQGGTPKPSSDQIWFRKEIGTLVALIGFVALLIGAFDGLLEARVLLAFAAARRSPTAPCRRTSAASGGRWKAALDPVRLHSGADLLSGLRARRHLRYAFQHGCRRASPTRSWSGRSSMPLIALALMPFAPKRASRAGIIGPSIVIALATVIIGYAALWLADLAFKIDFRFWIVALKTDERQTVPDLPDLPGAVHRVLRDRAACAAPEFLDHGNPARQHFI